MTITTRNEAAERLRDAIWTAPNDLGLYVKDVDEALAAERHIVEAECDERITVVRRATVERINEAVNGITFEATSASRVHGQLEALGAVQAILDEEAAR